MESFRAPAPRPPREKLLSPEQSERMNAELRAQVDKAVGADRGARSSGKAHGSIVTIVFLLPSAFSLTLLFAYSFDLSHGLSVTLAGVAALVVAVVAVCRNRW